MISNNDNPPRIYPETLSITCEPGFVLGAGRSIQVLFLPPKTPLGLR